MGLSIHDPYIMVRILVTDLVSAGPVGGPFLNEGPHEIMHDEEFQMGLVELVNMLDNLFYHQPLMDLVLGQTPVHQDSRVEVASLHPALLREHIEGAIVTEFQFYDVRKTARLNETM